MRGYGIARGLTLTAGGRIDQDRGEVHHPPKSNLLDRYRTSNRGRHRHRGELISPERKGRSTGYLMMNDEPAFRSQGCIWMISAYKGVNEDTTLTGCPTFSIYSQFPAQSPRCMRS